MPLSPESRLAHGLALAAGLIIAATIGGIFFLAGRSTDALAVTGSAKTQVTADHGKLVLSISREVHQSMLRAGYAQIASDRAAVEKFLADQGVEKSALVVNPVFSGQLYDYNNPNAEPRYTLSQTIEYQSDEVQKIKALAESIPAVAQEGVLVSIQSVEYTYSKLPDLRVSLLADAMKDARARANEIAKSAGSGIGSVRSASSGVVQVLPRNSIDVADYGAYDTSSIEKDVMVTVRAEFGMR